MTSFISMDEIQQQIKKNIAACYDIEYKLSRDLYKMQLKEFKKKAHKKASKLRRLRRVTRNLR